MKLIIELVGSEIQRALKEEEALLMSGDKAPCSVCGRPTGGCCTVPVFVVSEPWPHDKMRCKCHAEERKHWFGGLPKNRPEPIVCLGTCSLVEDEHEN